jgi:hypothetical protein
VAPGYVRQEGASASTLDGTLRAIVAADRLALSEAGEGKELLHRRLTVFYGYFALLGALGAIAGRVRRFPADADPRLLALLLDVQSAHALVLCAIFVALFSRVREPRLVRALDVLATVSTSVTAAVALSVVPYALTVDVTAVSFFILFFALRAALVPSKPWLATLVAAVSAIPFTIGLANMYQRAIVPDLAAHRAATRGPHLPEDRRLEPRRRCPVCHRARPTVAVSSRLDSSRGARRGAGRGAASTRGVSTACASWRAAWRLRTSATLRPASPPAIRAGAPLNTFRQLLVFAARDGHGAGLAVGQATTGAEL